MPSVPDRTSRTCEQAPGPAATPAERVRTRFVQKCTLTTPDSELVGVDLDLAVQDGEVITPRSSPPRRSALAKRCKPEFRDFARQVKANAAKLAAVLADGRIEIVTGGTDTHIVLLDLSRTGLTGEAAENILESAGITSNKNPIPFDVASPARWSGLRLGVVAATTRGFGEPEFETVGRLIAALLSPAGKEGSGHCNRSEPHLRWTMPLVSSLQCCTEPIFGPSALKEFNTSACRWGSNRRSERQAPLRA